MTSRWRQIEKLYHQARECAESDRAAFLETACAGDAELRQQVESLLADESSEFMQAPAIVEAAKELARDGRNIAEGQQLGAYTILSPLGRGGMGEVYRALDTKLKREVAIKFLAAPFANDRERLARFEREAQALASLNHPGIAAIYGLEEIAGLRFLILELVEGPTIAERLAEGRIEPLQVLRIAAQIAEAVEAAHEKGIVHRDLKPANVKLTPDGKVKVLDFGLAKALADSSSYPESAPTVRTGETRTGVIMGTAAYMSPEQASGRPVDKRTDIWSFGVMLYEMLSGKRPFEGKSASHIVVEILERDPDWSALPALAPGVQDLLERCLEKDPANRLRSMGDISVLLQSALKRQPRSPQPAPNVRKGRSYWRAGLLVAAVVVLAAAAVLFFNARQKPSAPVQLSIPFLQPPVQWPFSIKHLAISDDGSRVAYAAANGLWIRRMDQKEPTLLVPGAGRSPFFSPDGLSIAFFDDSGLQKIAVDGGVPVKLSTSSVRFFGGAWHAKGGIVFASTEGLFQIAPEGGTPRLLAKPSRDRKEQAYTWPQFLPDGESILFTILPEGAIDNAQIAFLDLKSLQSKVVLKGGASAQYIPTGQLVYTSGRSLKAIPFDPVRRETNGDSLSLSDIDVFVGQDNGATDFAISASGSLVFLSKTVRNPVALRWMDRAGKEEVLPIKPVSCVYPRVSPDGKRVALDCPGETGRDVWILNLERMSLTQLTDGPTEDMLPMWSPDGSRIFFASDRAGNFDVYSQAWDGASGPRVELAAPETQVPNSFTADGSQLIVYHAFKDLNIMNLAQPARMMPLLNSEFDERLSQVSLDGKWLAYESDESGKQFEIMLRPFPNVGDRREQISINGGRYPLWSPKGDELYYVTPNGEMMSVPVTLSPALKLGRPSKLFDWQKPSLDRSGRTYDVSRADGRFIMTKPIAENRDASTNVSVILNWSENLRKRFTPR